MMKVFFLGNCQVNAMRGLCREMFPLLIEGQFSDDHAVLGNV